MLNKNMIQPKNAFTLLCFFLRNTRTNMMGNIKMESCQSGVTGKTLNFQNENRKQVALYNL